MTSTGEEGHQGRADESARTAHRDAQRLGGRRLLMACQIMCRAPMTKVETATQFSTDPSTHQCCAESSTGQLILDVIFQSTSSRTIRKKSMCVLPASEGTALDLVRESLTGMDIPVHRDPLRAERPLSQLNGRS